VACERHRAVVRPSRFTRQGPSSAAISRTASSSGWTRSVCRASFRSAGRAGKRRRVRRRPRGRGRSRCALDDHEAGVGHRGRHGVDAGLEEVGAVSAGQHEGGHRDLRRPLGIEGYLLFGPGLPGDRVCGGDACLPRRAQGPPEDASTPPRHPSAGRSTARSACRSRTRGPSRSQSQRPRRGPAPAPARSHCGCCCWERTARPSRGSSGR